MAHFDVYSWGFIYASVCTDLSDQEATEQINLENPTGIPSRWQISDDKTFADGQPHPNPCKRDPSRRHVLFNC
jgi:hypothetical protein